MITLWTMLHTHSMSMPIDTLLHLVPPQEYQYNVEFSKNTLQRGLYGNKSEHM